MAAARRSLIAAASGSRGSEQRLHLQVGALRVRETSRVELRVADDGPGRALHGGVDRRLAREHEARDFEGLRQVLQVVVLARRARQQRRALRVRREGHGEALLALEALAVPRRRAPRRPATSPRARSRRARRSPPRPTSRGTGRHRRCARTRRRRTRKSSLSNSVSASRKLVPARFRVVGEGLQELAVPARRLVVVRLLLRALRLGVVVLREVGEVGLELAARPAGTARACARPRTSCRAGSARRIPSCRRARAGRSRPSCRPRSPASAAAARARGPGRGRRRRGRCRRRRCSAPWRRRGRRAPSRACSRTGSRRAAPGHGRASPCRPRRRS